MLDHESFRRRAVNIFVTFHHGAGFTIGLSLKIILRWWVTYWPAVGIKVKNIEVVCGTNGSSWVAHIRWTGMRMTLASCENKISIGFRIFGTPLFQNRPEGSAYYPLVQRCTTRFKESRT